MRNFLIAAITAGAVGACYSPNARDCVYTCATGGACPSGLQCGGENMCRDPDKLASSCGVTADMRPPIDAALDAFVDPDSGVCNWVNVSTNFDVTDLPVSGGFDWVIDADTPYATGSAGAPHGASILQPGGRDAWLVHVHDFTVAAGKTLTIKGTQPLIIAADTIAIHGTIVVDNTDTPPPDDCIGQPGASVCAAAGGGGGGGYGGVGAIGGHGAGGGSASGIAEIPLRAGCAGGVGGNGWKMNGDASAQPGGLGGKGGGALQLSARVSLVIDGTIDAHGNGGGFGKSDAAGGLACSGGLGRASGGGGGGGGGTVVLESCSVELAATAQVCASGGSGGGGAGGGQVNQGMVGNPGNCNGPALGGQGEVPGTNNGGTGAYDIIAPGAGLAAARGGGGGGGAVGRIFLRGVEGPPVTAPGARLVPAANRTQ